MYSLCRFRDFLLCVSRRKQARVLPCVTDFPDRLDCRHGAVHGRFARMNVIMRSSRHIGVPEQTCDRRNVHALLDGARRKRMPLRYNYDKPEKPRISRAFGYLARFFILFQTEKSSREVVIS